MNGNTVLTSLNGVSKVYANGTEALSGFDLKLNVGERVSLLGASGCGKSTALRLMAGLDEPSSGTVKRANKTVNLGFVFQEATLLPWLSVWDNIFMPLRLAKISKQEATPLINNMLERVDLTEFAHVYPRELSGGMSMRVSLARALVTKPNLLLMDEPFAALDEITRFRLNDMLLELQAREGFALCFVTHSVFESVYLSERVVVLSPRPGRVVDVIETAPELTRDTAFRTSAKYAAICRKVSGALETANVGAPENIAP